MCFINKLDSIWLFYLFLVISFLVYCLLPGKSMQAPSHLCCTVRFIPFFFFSCQLSQVQMVCTGCLLSSIIMNTPTIHLLLSVTCSLQHCWCEEKTKACDVHLASQDNFKSFFFLQWENWSDIIVQPKESEDACSADPSRFSSISAIPLRSLFLILSIQMYCSVYPYRFWCTYCFQQMVVQSVRSFDKYITHYLFTLFNRQHFILTTP